MELKLTSRLPERHHMSRDLAYLRSKTGYAKIWIVKNKGQKSLIHKSSGNYVSSYTTDKINEHLDQIPELVNEGQRGDFVLLSDENVVYRDSALMFWDGSKVILPEYDDNISDYGLVPTQFYDIRKNFNYWEHSTMVETTATDLQYFFEQNGMSELQLKYKDKSLSFYGVKDNGGKIALLGRSPDEFQKELQERRLLVSPPSPFLEENGSKIFERLGVITNKRRWFEQMEDRLEKVKVYLDGEKLSKKSSIVRTLFEEGRAVYFTENFHAWAHFDVDKIPEDWRKKLKKQKSLLCRTDSDSDSEEDDSESSD